MVSDRQRLVVHETRMAANAVRIRNLLHFIERESDEAVALALDAFHDCASVDAYNAVDMDAKGRCLADGMSGLRGGNQKLARHATDARAGGAIVAALDHHRAGCCGFGCAVRGHACSAGADDSNVNLQSVQALQDT